MTKWNRRSLIDPRRLTVVEDPGDPEVGDRGSVMGFGPEAVDEPTIPGVFAAEQLDRHWAVQDLVDSLPGLTHAPAASRRASRWRPASWQSRVSGAWGQLPAGCRS